MRLGIRAWEYGGKRLGGHGDLGCLLFGQRWT